MALSLTQLAPQATSLVSDRSLRLRTNLFLNLFSKTKNNKNIIGLQKLPARLEVTPRLIACHRVHVNPILEDATMPPPNLYTNVSPLTASILSIQRISAETYHIQFENGGCLTHWEGQVFGVMPVPENPFEPGDARKISYFSAASSRYGDQVPYDGRSTSLCVRLVRNTTSEILCRSSIGDKFQFTGPTGQAMLLGDYRNLAEVKHIFVATGAGVAPFRAHLRRFFKEDNERFRFVGSAWLFHGVTNKDSRLYSDEFTEYTKHNPNQFRYNCALSKDEGRYVQDIFRDHAVEVLDWLLRGAHIYLAGRREMVTPIEEALRDAATGTNRNWNEIKEGLHIADQWRVQVY